MTEAVKLSIIAALTLFTINGRSIACYDPRIIGKLTSIAIEGNHKIFALYGTVRIVKGDCVQLNDGTAVTIEETDEDDSAICVRPLGDVRCWWISPEEVNGLTPEGLRDALEQP
jgi:hypothetical protein